MFWAEVVIVYPVARLLFLGCTCLVWPLTGLGLGSDGNLASVARVLWVRGRSVSQSTEQAFGGIHDCLGQQRIRSSKLGPDRN